VYRRLGATKGHCNSRGLYIFFYRKENENHQLEKGFLVHHTVVSAVKKVEILVIGCYI